MMYKQIKDIRILKILQKSREFSDIDLSNEYLIENLLNSKINQINNEEKNQIINTLNSLINSKEKALLSNK